MVNRHRRTSAQAGDIGALAAAAEDTANAEAEARAQQALLGLAPPAEPMQSPSSNRRASGTSDWLNGVQ